MNENYTKLNLKTIKKKLSPFKKIIVTGPPRAGTTISAFIIAKTLGYKFIDESFYDANNPDKFFALLNINNRKIVVHCTAFMRDLPRIKPFLDINNIAIVVVHRTIKDILASYENTKNFEMGALTENGIFQRIDNSAIGCILNAYGYPHNYKDKPLPQIIYDHFYQEVKENNLDINKLFYINYNDLSSNKYFVGKKERRATFKHIKQIVPNDPYFLQNQVIVL
jgi:hypothetical protein